MSAVFRVFARCLAIVVSIVPALGHAAIWQDLTATGAAAKGADTGAVYYRPLRADAAQLRQALAGAPLELTSSRGSTLVLPLPDGTNQLFEVEESPVMAPTMAAAFPDIRTYRVRGVDDPALSGRLDMTPSGFHAMLDGPGDTVFIDPDGNGGYRSFYKRDYAAAVGAAASPVCHVDGEQQPDAGNLSAPAQRTLSLSQRRIYRLAVAVTGEYAGYFNNAQSAIVSNVVTTVNRVNQVYGRDLALQLQLVKVVIYNNALSDPYTQANPSLMLVQNQQALDQEVGTDNYDIGHLFGLAGGGLALVGATCSNSKAQGYTGHPVPDSDVFYIDFVAHEMGHQMGATHTFNGTTDACGGANRSAQTAVEPGSGSTIMAYAGICGAENLQDNSEATFHATSIQQVHDYTFNGTGSTCGTLSATGDTLPGSVYAGADRTIPQGTPFVLSGTVSADPDGDTLSYQWDELDSGGSTGATDYTTFGDDLGNNPLFRSFVPRGTPTRHFPRLSTLISGTPDKGEVLPTTQRTLHFRLTVRDGKSGVADDDVAVTVDTSMGPFQVTGGELNQSGNRAYAGGSGQSLTWSNTGTTVDCPDVSISLLSLSSDGSTYCDVEDYPALLDVGITANDGSEDPVNLPDAAIARARVMLTCPGSGYFDISDHDFRITGSTAVASDCKSIDGDPVEHGTVFVSPASGISLPTSGGGGGGGGLLWIPLLLGVGGLARYLGRSD